MITLSRPTYDTLVRRAYQGGAEEICGILGGTYQDDTTLVSSVHAAENVADVPEVRYYIDPEEQFALTETIENAGEEIVGFYHSHPAGPPTPSETDRQRATWPDRSYVIISLDGYPFVGSWRWRADDEAFEQEIVRVTQP